MTQRSKKFFLAWLILFIINLFVLIIVLLPEITRVPSLNQWHLQILRDGEKQFLQWDSIDEENEFHAKLLRAESKNKNRLPSIERTGFKNLKVQALSSYKVSESDWEIILYDQWSKNENLPFQLKPRSNVSRKKILLIDASATMNEKKDRKQTQLEILYKNLLTLRKTDSSEWDVFSFSNGLKRLGRWQGNGENLLENIVEGQGATRLLHALKLLDSKINEPSFIVVFTDGKVSELNKGSYKNVFNSLSDKNHKVSILSPSLSKCSEFNEFYQSNQVLSSFEVSHEEEGVEDNLNGIHWVNRRNVIGDRRFSPLAWDQHGQAYAYLTRVKGKQQVHLAGFPSDGAKSFLKQLSADLLEPIVLSISAKSILLDVNKFLWHPVVVWDDGWSSLNQISPGVYDLANKSLKMNHVRFFHPSLGAFSIKNFQEIGEWVKKYPAKKRSKLRIKSLKESLTDENRRKIVQLILFNISAMLLLLWLKRYLEGRSFSSPPRKT